jgi:hypothetical protein
VSFRCDALHELAVGDLLRGSSPALRGALLHLMGAWQNRIEILLRAADEARRRSIPDVGEHFVRHADSLKAHAQFLERALREAGNACPESLPEAAVAG